MTPDRIDSPPGQHPLCTCNLGRWPGGPEWDPDCPRHGRYAEPTTHDGDPDLDIDTSYLEGDE